MGHLACKATNTALSREACAGWGRLSLTPGPGVPGMYPALIFQEPHGSALTYRAGHGLWLPSSGPTWTRALGSHQLRPIGKEFRIPNNSGFRGQGRGEGCEGSSRRQKREENVLRDEVDEEAMRRRGEKGHRPKPSRAVWAPQPQPLNREAATVLGLAACPAVHTLYH